MILKFKDVLPNPNRDLKRNPLDPDKLKELIDSINDTGFWDNVVVRKNADGQYECAYGHTRIAAAIKAGLTEANFIVKSFDDEMMIKVMGRENSDTYQYSILALLEKVRAVVIGLADGRVKPFEIGKDTNTSVVCYAPSFVAGEPVSKLLTRRYTVGSIAKFLGMASVSSEGKTVADNGVIAALGALRLIQNKKMTEDEIKDLKVSQLLKVVRDRTVRVESIQKTNETKAEQQRIAGLSLQQQLKVAEAAKKAAKAEGDRLLKARMEATRKEDEAKAEQILEEQKKNALDRAETERKQKIALKEYEKNQKQIAASVAALNKQKEDLEKREAAAWVSFGQNFCDSRDRLGTGEDRGYADAKVIGRGARTTEKQRNACITALEEAASRLLQMRVFIRPELGKKK